MGCFNKTCALTNLPILNGEKVLVVTIIESSYPSSCHTTGIWSPFEVPWVGYYDDYGGTENEDGTEATFLQYLSIQGTLDDIGDKIDVNKFTRPKTDSDGLTYFYDLASSFILRATKPATGASIVTYVMVKHDLAEELCSNIEVFRDDGLGYYKTKLFPSPINVDGVLDKISSIYHPLYEMEIGALDKASLGNENELNRANMFSIFRTVEELKRTKG